jgi:hypothetical protein
VEAGTVISSTSITGISAALDSYTVKASFFEDEAIVGRSEIGAGSGDIESGTLSHVLVEVMMLK